ncbi:hypothetical protein DY000_02062880 [Brassica cretica]|uniref:Uncharacterized protein n=1 Tax=Brassica cretica TaxID=69181 RepID=A0ABQ7APV1_BRACR|nr:hypothetical protein DY000_02062880 [Brassica cretica]
MVAEDSSGYRCEKMKRVSYRSKKMRQLVQESYSWRHSDNNKQKEKSGYHCRGLDGTNVKQLLALPQFGSSVTATRPEGEERVHSGAML